MFLSRAEKHMPANLARISNFVTGQTSSNRLWGAIVEQNLHELAVGNFARLWLAKWMTAFTSSAVTSKTSVISLSDMPASRFSKTVCTGIRVPLKTHAPLTLPGMLSTAGHWDQSRLAIIRTSSHRITQGKASSAASLIMQQKMDKSGTRRRTVLPLIHTDERRSKYPFAANQDEFRRQIPKKWAAAFLRGPFVFSR